MRNPFRYFNSSPEVIRLTVMMYLRYPLSLRQVEDLLFERGIDICHETIRFWWNRFVSARYVGRAGFSTFGHWHVGPNRPLPEGLCQGRLSCWSKGLKGS
jgi:transposase-like protein